MPETAVILPNETARALAELTGETRTDIALALVIRDYARHKLAEIEGALQKYEETYKVPFETYRRRWENDDIEELYSYEAEWDYLDWEGLVTQHRRLSENFAWLP
ncbi:MAG: hypothetical protein HY784_13365 [Chloroflexi bacterium]|nr:hypothetical protein [Chloroflexota bacterium]